MPEQYDVVVVGARVAGASTAMLLARAGARVALLDRDRYASDTLSTHALLRAGVLQLSRWGLLPAVVAAGTPAVRRTVFHYADGESVPVDIRPSRGVDALYAPRRCVLDRLLVDAAAAAGVTVRHETTVTGLRRDGDRVAGVRAAGVDGRAWELRSRLVVGADGIRSVVAADVGAPTLRTGGARGGALYGYFAGVPVGGYEWSYGEGAAAAMVPTNDGLTMVSAGAAPARMRALRRAGMDAAFDALVAAGAPGELARIRDGRPVGALRGWGGIRSYVRRSFGPGWALVGDAGYFKDPITAHGMTDALRDAELLAGAVARVLSGAEPEDLALRRYQERRDAVSARLFEAGDRLAGFAWSLAEVRPLLREVSAAMNDEVALLENLPDHPGDDHPGDALARAAPAEPARRGGRSGPLAGAVRSRSTPPRRRSPGAPGHA